MLIAVTGGLVTGILRKEDFQEQNSHASVACADASSQIELHVVELDSVR
jgi:hypothetical protein